MLLMLLLLLSLSSVRAPWSSSHPRSEEPKSRTSNKKRRTKQLDILKEDGGRKERAMENKAAEQVSMTLLYV